MLFDPDIHHRRSIRLKGYDYARVGAYFVTVCVQGREGLLGEIADGEMRLNGAGEMVEGWWRKLPQKFPNATLDEYIIMPNHFHAIVTIVGADPCVRPGFPDPCVRPGFPDPCVRPGFPDPCVRPGFPDPCVRPRTNQTRGIHGEGAHVKDGGAHVKDEGAHAGAPLHRMVQWFKTLTTNAYIRGVFEHEWRPLPGRLWQRNYYERVIRDEKELTVIRAYIRDNPANWHEDEENPL